MSIERGGMPTQKAPKRKRGGIDSLPPKVYNRTKERLTAITADPKAYIDEGGAARVYRLPAGVCMKVMRPHNESRAAGLSLGNSLEQEAAFLERLSGTVVSGTRSPRYVSSVRDENFSALLMEQVNGSNLQKILAREVELPAAFDHHAFFDALEKYVQALHEKEHILHGDLEPRNVMVDNQTGTPWVIDFGRAKSIENLTPDVRRRVEHEEWEKLNDLEEKMAQLRAI